MTFSGCVILDIVKIQWHNTCASCDTERQMETEHKNLISLRIKCVLVNINKRNTFKYTQVTQHKAYYQLYIKSTTFSQNTNYESNIYFTYQKDR